MTRLSHPVTIFGIALAVASMPAYADKVLTLPSAVAKQKAESAKPAIPQSAQCKRLIAAADMAADKHEAAEQNAERHPSSPQAAAAASRAAEAADSTAAQVAAWGCEA